MSHNKRALLIVEGASTEPKIIGRADGNIGLFPFMGITNYQIFRFNSSIYELYEAYKAGDYDDLIAYLVAEGRLILPANQTSRTAFSAVYLLFDFDPQYHKYSDAAITEMCEIFNNETELGKLYISYPMVEACKHIKSLPDPDFNELKIAIDNNLNSKNYKKLVNRETCMPHLTNEKISYMLLHNYNKAKLLDELPGRDVDYAKILQKQITEKNTNSSIYVLGTLPLMALDYNAELAASTYSLQFVKDNDKYRLDIKH